MYKNLCWKLLQVILQALELKLFKVDTAALTAHLQMHRILLSAGWAPPPIEDIQIMFYRRGIYFFCKKYILLLFHGLCFSSLQHTEQSKNPLFPPTRFLLLNYWVLVVCPFSVVYCSCCAYFLSWSPATYWCGLFQWLCGSKTFSGCSRVFPSSVQLIARVRLEPIRFCCLLWSSGMFVVLMCKFLWWQQYLFGERLQYNWSSKFHLVGFFFIILVFQTM